MDLTRLRDINERNRKELQIKRQSHQEVEQNLQTQETIVQSFRALVDYLDNRTSKTAVVNQLKEIGTPDALKVVDSVSELHETIKAQEKDHEKVSTSLSKLEELMASVLSEAKQIPKQQTEIEIPEQVDYTTSFESLGTQLKELTDAVREGKDIHMPKVDVPTPETNVTVDTNPIAKEVGKTSRELQKLSEKQPEVVKGAMQTQDVSNLISEPYTRFNISYINDGFEDEDEEPLVGSIKYYNGNKLVATLVMDYDGRNLTKMKKI